MNNPEDGLISLNFAILSFIDRIKVAYAILFNKTCHVSPGIVIIEDERAELEDLFEDPTTNGHQIKK